MSGPNVAAIALADVLKDSGEKNDQLVRQTEALVARSRTNLPLPADAEPARVHLCAIAACKIAGKAAETARIPLPPKKLSRFVSAFCKTLVPLENHCLVKDAAALCTRAGRAHLSSHLVFAVSELRKLHPRQDSYFGLLYTAALFIFAKAGGKSNNVNSISLRKELFAAIDDESFGKQTLDKWIALLRDEIEHSHWYNQSPRQEKLPAATGSITLIDYLSDKRMEAYNNWKSRILAQVHKLENYTAL